MGSTDEQLFTQVTETFSKLGIQMDKWTATKYQGLQNAFSKTGKLSESQKKLLLALPEKVIQYKQNAPAEIKSSADVIEEIENAKPMTPEERFPNYDINLVNYVLEFEAKMRTSWYPTKEEIFKYGYNMRRLGKHYSPPKKWTQEFNEYESNNLHS